MLRGSAASRATFAPTDAALRFDLQKHKDLGFNAVRKHIEVEPQRWFCRATGWACRCGRTCPPWTAAAPPDAAARTQGESGFRAPVDRHRSPPSLIMRVSRNEGRGQCDRARIADMVKAYDPTRLVDDMSGVDCCGAVDGGNGDVVDHHDYVGPGNTEPSTTRAAVLGEYGGLGFRGSGHEWYPGGGFGYEDQASTAALNDRLVGLLDAIRENSMPAGGLSAAVHTRITGVENEANGLLTYDRRVVEAEEARVRAADQALVAVSRTVGAAGRVALRAERLDPRDHTGVHRPLLTDRYSPAASRRPAAYARGARREGAPPRSRCRGGAPSEVCAGAGGRAGRSCRVRAALGRRGAPPPDRTSFVLGRAAPYAHDLLLLQGPVQALLADRAAAADGLRLARLEECGARTADGEEQFGVYGAARCGLSPVGHDNLPWV